MTTVELKDGLKHGDLVLREVVLRQVTAADIFAAQDAAERLVYSPGADGGLVPVLVTSPAMMGREILKRQIVSIGDIPADKIDMALIGRLSSGDLAIIEHAAEALEAGAMNAMKRAEERGRSDGTGADT